MNVGMYGGKFLPLHQGHVNSIVKASTMVDKLYIVLSHSEERDSKLCLGRMKYPKKEIRLQWLNQITKDMENVQVIEVEDNSENYEIDDWKRGSEEIKKKIGETIDFVFGSEVSYKPIFADLYPEATYIILDSDRKEVPISATTIRNEGVFKHWNYIPNPVKPFFTKKVVIVGTESCGKSTLTKNLAKIFNTNYVEEYGRTRCEEIGGCNGLTDDDFNLIAYKHKVLENDALQIANKVLFIDTEAIITDYYSMLYMKKPNPIAHFISWTENYDLWIYLTPDVLWVDDGTRLHGNTNIRKENDEMLQDLLINEGIDYKIVSGNYKDRLEKSIELVNNLF